jgi:predicted RNA-binding Zn-ribbon protein involved in translation (DUF1610 family)
MSQSFPPDDYIPSRSTIPGIEVYAPKPEDAGPHQEVVDFKCPQCGASTAFSAEDGGLTCKNCGYYEPPRQQAVGKQAKQYEFTVETMARAAQGWGVARKEMECQNCGAFTSVPVESLTHTCPFCGSNKVIQREAPQDVLRPRFLIPFKIDQKACHSIARQWLGSSWMTPSNLSKIGTLANFTGVYLPFWTITAATSADWKAEVGHQQTERYRENGEWKERTVTVWRWESGHVDLQINDLVIEGTARLSQKLLSSIKQFDMESLAPYEAKYLPGMQAQAYDVALEKAWEIGRQQMREQTRSACVSRASTSQVRNFSMNLDFSEESWRYVLLPVYLSTYSLEGKVFQVMINGQTGTISGQRPVDWNKVWLVFALLLAPGVVLGLLGLVTVVFGGVGVAIGGCGLLLLIIGLVIGVIILVQANAMDDV